MGDYKNCAQVKADTGRSGVINAAGNIFYVLCPKRFCCKALQATFIRWVDRDQRPFYCLVSCPGATYGVRFLARAAKWMALLRLCQTLPVVPSLYTKPGRKISPATLQPPLMAPFYLLLALARNVPF